jgi:hypothetical protein
LVVGRRQVTDDTVGALAMLPVILWQGWETLAEAREPADLED